MTQYFKSKIIIIIFFFFFNQWKSIVDFMSFLRFATTPVSVPSWTNFCWNLSWSSSYLVFWRSRFLVYPYRTNNNNFTICKFGESDECSSYIKLNFNIGKHCRYNVYIVNYMVLMLLYDSYFINIIFLAVIIFIKTSFAI